MKSQPKNATAPQTSGLEDLNQTAPATVTITIRGQGGGPIYFEANAAEGVLRCPLGFHEESRNQIYYSHIRNGRYRQIEGASRRK